MYSMDDKLKALAVINGFPTIGMDLDQLEKVLEIIEIVRPTLAEDTHA